MYFCLHKNFRCTLCLDWVPNKLIFQKKLQQSALKKDRKPLFWGTQQLLKKSKAKVNFEATV